MIKHIILAPYWLLSWIFSLLGKPLYSLKTVSYYLGYSIYLVLWLVGQVVLFIAGWIDNILMAIFDPFLKIFGLATPKLTSTYYYLSLLFYLVKGLLSYIATISIPVVALIVWKSKLSYKVKFSFISSTTILLGFMMLVIEINKTNSSFGLSSTIRDARLTRPEKGWKVRSENPFLGSFNDYDSFVDSTNGLFSLKQQLLLPGTQAVLNMPSYLLREEAIVRAFEELKVLDKVQKISFQVNLDQKKGQIYVSDIPFLGAQIAYENAKANYKRGQTIIWIDEDKLDDLETQKFMKTLQKIENDPSLKPTILISTGNNKLFNQLQRNQDFDKFVFTSCYEKRMTSQSFFSEKISQKNQEKGAVSQAMDTTRYIEQMGYDFEALERYSRSDYSSIGEFLTREKFNLKKRLSYLSGDQKRLNFLRNLAHRMVANQQYAANRWIDYADIFEIGQEEEDIDRYISDSLEDGVLVQSMNKYRFATNVHFQIFYLDNAY